MTGEGEPDMSPDEHAHLAAKNKRLAIESAAAAVGFAALGIAGKNAEMGGAALGSAVVAGQAANEARKHKKAAEEGD